MHNVPNLVHCDQVKPLKFHPRVQEFIRGLSVELRKQIGEALRDVQKGLLLGMPLSRPMPSVAPGAYELRASDKTKRVRVFYLVKIEDLILVFHAFEKKSRKTPRHEIELAKQRLKDLLNE